MPACTQRGGSSRPSSQARLKTRAVVVGPAEVASPRRRGARRGGRARAGRAPPPPRAARRASTEWSPPMPSGIAPPRWIDLGVGLDARERVLDVAGHGGRVAVVDARQRAPHHHVLRRVVRAQQRGGRAHRLGPEARAGPVRRARIPRHAEERDVDAARSSRRAAAGRTCAGRCSAGDCRASTGSYMAGGSLAPRSASARAGARGRRWRARGSRRARRR